MRRAESGLETGRRTLFVHVGQSRTGTTSIQEMLHRFSPRLRRLGVHVLKTAARRGNHRYLVMPWTGAHSSETWIRESLWEAARDEIARCPASRIVVSAEQFTNPGVSRAGARLFAALAEDAEVDVRIIGVVRPQWQWMEASWSQCVVDGLSRPRFEDCVAGYLSNTRLDYAGVFRPWRDTFGAVRIIPLQRSRLPRGLLVHFLQTLGVDDERLLSSVEKLPNAHARPGAKAAEAYRVTRAGLAALGLAHQECGRLLDHVAAGLRELLLNDRPFAGLSNEQACEVAHHFAPMNRSFARAYGVGVDGELFPDPVGDSYARPSIARWEEFEPLERSALRAYLRARLGLQLPDRLPTHPGNDGPVDSARRDALRQFCNTLPRSGFAHHPTVRRCGKRLVYALRRLRLYRGGVRLMTWLWRRRLRTNPGHR